MDAAERLSRLRADAAQRLRTITGALDALLREREQSTDDDEHDPDGVTLSSEWSRLSGLADAARDEVALFDDAIARVAAGTYGKCARCGTQIPAARLAARPFAEYCVPCAEALGR